jgi:hypothetical protein
MTRIPETCSPVNARIVLEAALDEAVQTLCQTIGARITALLVAIVSHVVGRPHYVRRVFVPKRLHREGKCPRCHSTQSGRFSRNGFRSRQPLLTIWGEVPFDLPRVRCQCGGSVQVDFGDVLHPYQQIGADVDAQIQRWGGMAVSLRRMHQELKHTYIGPLALRTLNQRLHLLATLDPHRVVEDVPPVVQLDAIWITLLRPNGQVCRDRKGRKRAVKGRFKVPVMIAMGVWPDSDRCEILSWYQGESESADEWVKFLETLEAQGICGRNGLKLIIHDGGLGLFRLADRLVRCRAATVPVPQAAEHRRCHPLARKDVNQGTQATAQEDPEGLQTNLGGVSLRDHAPPLPQGRSYLSPHTTRGGGHSAPRLSTDGHLLWAGNRIPDLGSQESSDDQPPGALQPHPPSSNAGGQCIPLDGRPNGYDRPGDPGIP